jgi:hypothetical protein
MHRTRRAVLGKGAAGIAGLLAGCGGGLGGATDTPAPTADSTPAGEGTPTGGGTGSASALPIAAERPYVGHELPALDEASMNGGVGTDGIPSIDDPSFAGPDAVDVADADPVFGVVHNGLARAYRQDVLVQHEIVNDVIGGDPVAVTYCPLTGTVQGFERGEVEFGVSGDLVNSNLIMYDRATDSRWPQIAKTAVVGPHKGDALREFRLVWTTWRRWREAHPETEVMTEDTGYARSYDNDFYGSYNPKGGYYDNDRITFRPMAADDRLPPKDVVLGARTEDGAIAFNKQSLLAEGVLTGSIGATPYVAVAEPALQTGYVYENSEERTVTAGADGYEVGAKTHPADTLPLDQVIAFDAMWFPWYGYYPETSYVE